MTTQNSKLRILLVEGSHHDRLVFLRAVRKGGLDCEIVECEQASAALSALNNTNERFDLVAMDLGLADMPGLDLYRKVKSRSDCPPFVILTGKAFMKKVVKALREGVFDYLVKEPEDIYQELLPVVLNNAFLRHRDRESHDRSEEVLRDAHSTLENEVRRRTAQLLRTNRRLKMEIDERKRLEEDLRQNEEQFTLFMDHFPGMAYLKDDKGRFLYLNHYIETNYGIKVQECIGKTAFDVWEKDITCDISEEDRKILVTGKDLQKVEDFSMGEKRISFLTWKFPIVGNDASKIIGGVSIDITDYRRTEQENRLLVSAIEHSTESVFILDASGMIQYLNPAAERSLAVSRREIIGKTYESYVSSGCGSGIVLSLKEIGDKPWRGFITRASADGVTREFDVIVSPVGDGPAKITNYTVIEHDVTEEKALQKALERKRRMEALGMLAGGIAHDFINILQPILINAELVSDMLPRSAPEHEYLGQIIEAARIGKDITNQIKMFGSKKKQVLKPVAIVPVVRDALRIISQSLPQHISLRQRIIPTKAMVRIDQPQFYQLITNLCMNAVQAMDSDSAGFLSVTLSESEIQTAVPAFVSVLNPGQYMKFTVKDTGCGMSGEVMEHIFDPLFTTKKTSKGTGLGLGVVHAVVKNAGGSIIVHSKPGKGSVFEVYLPKDTGHYEERTQEETVLHSSNRKVRILLVDDNALELRSIHHMLIRMGYRVTSTHDSLKALDLFRQTPEAFDLLITDQLMPRMNGDVMAEAMLSLRNDLPVIICSGSDKAIQDLRERKGSVAKCLSKPFSSNCLADTIDRALDRGGFTIT